MSKVILSLIILSALAGTQVAPCQDQEPSAAVPAAPADQNSIFPEQDPPQTNSGEQRKPVPAAADDKEATRVNRITGLGMVDSADYKPLTGRQRWNLYLGQNFTTVGAYFAPVTMSFLDQAENHPPEWGGGMAGYGRRLASRIGTGIVQGTVQAAGAAALGQDPRYIRSSDPRVLHRIGHAFLFSILTYNNEGKKRLALANLGSYYAGSMLTTSWYPERYTALGDGVREGNKQVMMAGLINQLQEFWPEIRRFILRRK